MWRRMWGSWSGRAVRHGSAVRPGPVESLPPGIAWRRVHLIPRVSQWRQEARDRRPDAASFALHESAVRGRLEAIDDGENLVHPIVGDEVNRPCTTQVRMRTE